MMYVDFGLAPTTHTRVVTTTTTTTTSFPPVVFGEPRLRDEDDGHAYPLLTAETPEELRRFMFEVDGRALTFTESGDAMASMKQVRCSRHQAR